MCTRNHILINYCKLEKKNKSCVETCGYAVIAYNEIIHLISNDYLSNYHCPSCLSALYYSM